MQSVISAFLAVDRVLNRIIAVVAVLALAIAACLGLLQVVSRFALKIPLEWTEVSIRIALAWMVFVGAALVFRAGAMIAVDMVRHMMPQRFKRLHDAFITLVTLGFLGLLGYWGYIYANRSATQTLLGLDFISVYWAYISIPIGCLCSAIAVIARFIEHEPVSDEEQELELVQ
ncbi:TRAP transporter small permease [Pelagibacterium mangrovi]|uniref:TRAP transporter small permease n=1 Tax=Pelagibacterium mangrovi TaxID=3119828 RepID=UPI002FCBC0BD